MDGFLAKNKSPQETLEVGITSLSFKKTAKQYSITILSIAI